MRGPADAFAEASRILEEGRVVALTGAGISQESGIPTFRGKGGLWEKYPPEDFATPDGLMNVYAHDAPRLAGFVREFYGTLVQAAPNEAHAALAKMEAQGLLGGVITQNIDGLHERAGSRNVMELHGNALRLRCPRCSAKRAFGIREVRDLLGRLEAGASSRRTLKALSHFFKKCPCGSRMRIDVVLFSEALPADVWQKAWEALEKAGTLLLVGTSGVVYPAASIPLRAKELGKRIIEVNLEKGDLSGIADHFLQGKAGEVMRRLVRR